jgi:hypothetical protein
MNISASFINSEGKTYGRRSETGVGFKNSTLASFPSDFSNETRADFKGLSRGIRPVGMADCEDEWSNEVGLAMI